jgi:phycoerythrin-associated linker protein
MPFGPASLLGVERFSAESEAPIELVPCDDDARKEEIIRAVYKQVLGNAYVMDSERQVVAESQFKLRNQRP